MRFRTRLLRFALTLLLAVSQMAMPVAAAARMAALASGGQVICTADGLRVVASADGDVAPGNNGAAHVDHCPLCLTAGAPPAALSIASVEAPFTRYFPAPNGTPVPKLSGLPPPSTDPPQSR